MKPSLAKLGFDPMFWQFLAKRRGGDVLRALASEARALGSELDAFDVAEAVYWIACDYGESEFCPGPYRPAEPARTYRPAEVPAGPDVPRAQRIRSD